MLLSSLVATVATSAGRRARAGCSTASSVLDMRASGVEGKSRAHSKQLVFWFPGSAWEPARCEAPPRHLNVRGGASRIARSQAEPGNEKANEVSRNGVPKQ